MNKVYKSVWNADAGTYVAAAETTRARGKQSGARKLLAPAMMLATAAGGVSNASAAAFYVNDSVTTGTTYDTCATLQDGHTPGTPALANIIWSPMCSVSDPSQMSSSETGTIVLNNSGALLNGRLTLNGGINVMNTQINNLADGTAPHDAVNLSQLNQRTRYFVANSPTSDASSDARATGTSSVAAGPFALATGANSTALGANTSALVSNSVALGAGSVASRNDSVSVGYLAADGKSQYTRQITNLTAGSAGTDAVNVNQLNAAINSVTGGVGGGNVPNAVVYDDSGKALVTLKGSAGTKITNLAAGDISSAWSMDAVNGSQLFQTNQNVANLSGDVTNIKNVVNNVINNGIAASPLVVQYDSSAQDSVTLGGANHAAAVKLTNVANGVLSGTSTDAVNGSQLYSTNQNVALLTYNVVNGGGIKYFHANSPQVDAVDSLAYGADSVAIGRAARAMAAGSVALGANTLADRANSVSVGSSTLQRQITNVAAATESTDAVNLGQMTEALKSISDGGSADAVIYDGSAHSKVTLGGTTASAPVALTNIAAGTLSASSKDAVNGSQLFATNSNLANLTNVVNNIGSSKYFHVNSTAADSNAAGVDSTAVGPNAIATASGTVALGVNSTALGKSSVALGDTALATTSDGLSTGYTGAVAVGNVAKAHGRAVAIGSNTSADDSGVALGSGATASQANAVALGMSSTTDRANSVSVGSSNLQRQITNVASGTQDTDAVNVGQLKTAIDNISGGGSLDAVVYDSSLHDKLTLGGKSSTTPVALTNVAAGQVTSSSTDAVNGSQLYGTANSVAAALGGGSSVSPTGTVTAPTYELGGKTYNDVGSALTGIGSAIDGINGNAASTSKYIKVVSASSAALATGGEAVAIGGGAYASGVNSLAFGSGARSQFENSVAIGSNSTTSVANTISVGSKGSERRIMNVADGIAKTDVATFGQLSALQTTVAQLATQSSGVKSMLMTATTPSVTDYISVSSNVTPGTATSTDNARDAMAIGPTANAYGDGSLAIGARSGTSLAGSTAVGSAAAALSVYTTVIGAGASTSNKADSAVAIGYNANAQAVSSLALGSDSQTNALNSVAIGSGSYVTTPSTNSMALGAAATATVANSVALGYNSKATRINTVSVGASGAERQIVNVAAGQLGTDAVNVSQLTGVTSMIGGGAGVNADGTIKMPAFTVDGKTFTDVGSALAAVATSGSPDGVQYDTSVHDKVTLGGVGSKTPVTVANVANGVADNDAANMQQLRAMGANVDSNGNVTSAFVAYDDTTKNSVTLKGASGSTKITGLTAGTLSASSTDAVNGSQLYSTNQNVANLAGNVINVTDTVNNITNGNAGIKYFHVNSTLADSSATGTDAMAIGANAKATANNSVALGANSVAGRANTVDVGSRQITDVAAGTQTTDAVNVGQLQALGANVDSSGNITNAFVAYDDTTKNSVTLKGASGSTKITGLTAGTLSASSTDAVNGSQLYSTNQNVANLAGNVINVTDTVNNITNGNAGIKYFHVNSTLADSSATGTDAMAIGANAKATANNSVALGANSTTTANLASAAYLAASGTLLATTPAGEVSVGSVGKERRLTNVAAGSAGTDAVNVSQLQAAVASASGTASVNAVQYDSSSHLKVTLGGTGASTPAVALTNLADGTIASTSSDAVNGSQLYGTANSVAAALGGGSSVSATGTVTNPAYKLSTGTYADVGSALAGIDGTVSSINNTITDTTKYIKVVSASSAALASGGEAVAIGGGAYSSAQNSLAIGSGARSQFADSVALGSNSVTSAQNTISVGARGAERRIMNVADGKVDTDVATFGQLTALQTTVTQLAQQSSGVRSMLQSAVLSSSDATSVSNYIAVSSNITPAAPAAWTDDSVDAMAIGPMAAAMGDNSLAIGASSATFREGSTAVGTRAAAISKYTTVIGAGASTNDKADGAVAIGYNAKTEAVSSLALGTDSQTNALNSIAIGSKSFVYTSGTNSIALGAGATAIEANSVALGANSTADRADTVSVGASGAERQIVNVKAGTADTDAVNVKQLSTAIESISGGGGTPNAVIYDTAAHDKLTLGGVNPAVAVTLTNVAAGKVASGSSDAVNGGQLYDTANSVAAALGGGSTVDANGNVLKPAYALDGTTYNDVGAALAAVDAKAGTGSADGVKYDTSAHDKVTFGGDGSKTPVTLSNVADGIANNDAVNVQQLKAMGANIDSSGNVTGAFVAYDDTSKGKVTFGGFGSTTPVTLTNVAPGQISSGSRDAINGSQLYGTASSVAEALGGGSSVTSNGSVTKPTYKLSGNTYSGVGAALAALDAKSTTGMPDGVVYDTPEHDKLTLGDADMTPVQLSNVADAKAENDAVNLKQLKAAGLNVDTSGNVTNSFVAYDDASKETVTFGNPGTATRLQNIADAVVASDAVNYGQMKKYVAENVGSGGTANAVSYDDSSKNTVTLGGAGHDPVTLTNVAAGTNANDAVNYSQFSSLQSQVNNLSSGGTGDTTYVNINNPASGGTAAVSSGTDAIAIGNGAVASGAAAIAIGKDAVTAGDNSVAMGSGASAPNTNSVALGSNSTTDRDNSVSMGFAGNERQITNVAAGTQATDAVNLGQLNNAMGGLNQSIQNVDRSAAKGIASASALNIVTPYLPGRTTLNAGIANYRGYQAIGLGVSRWNEKGTINYNLGVSSSGGNSTIVRAGVGIVLGN